MTKNRRLAASAAMLAAAAGFSLAAGAEDIKLRIASGHPTANTYVHLMNSFFVPEVTKRVAARTKHKVEFIEGYGGSIVKVADTLEGVQSGIIDLGIGVEDDVVAPFFDHLRTAVGRLVAFDRGFDLFFGHAKKFTDRDGAKHIRQVVVAHQLRTDRLQTGTAWS